MKIHPEHVRRAESLVSSPADDPEDKSVFLTYLEGVERIVQEGETLTVNGFVTLYAETHEYADGDIKVVTQDGTNSESLTPDEFRKLCWAGLALADAVEGT